MNKSHKVSNLFIKKYIQIVKEKEQENSISEMKETYLFIDNKGQYEQMIIIPYCKGHNYLLDKSQSFRKVKTL